MRRCPLLAQSGHPSLRCLFAPHMSAYDPKRTPTLVTDIILRI
jgi:hypothetical protein